MRVGQEEVRPLREEACNRCLNLKWNDSSPVYQVGSSPTMAKPSAAPGSARTVTALQFFNDVGKIAEAEDHHPDLHLTGYRMAAIEMTTHAIGGLSENDFILAAKIDEVK